VEHGRCEGTGRVTVHGELIEGSRVALVELENGVVPECRASEDGCAVINVSVEDHEQERVSLASPEELAVIKVSGVADGDEGGGVVEVEDAVGGLCAVDTAQEFDILVVVGRWEVAGTLLKDRSSLLPTIPPSLFIPNLVVANSLTLSASDPTMPCSMLSATSRPPRSPSTLHTPSTLSSLSRRNKSSSIVPTWTGSDIHRKI